MGFSVAHRIFTFSPILCCRYISLRAVSNYVDLGVSGTTMSAESRNAMLTIILEEDMTDR